MSQLVDQYMNKGAQQQEQEDRYGGVEQIKEDHETKDSGKNRGLQEAKAGALYPFPYWKKISVAP